MSDDTFTPTNSFINNYSFITIESTIVYYLYINSYNYRYKVIWQYLIK